MTVGIARRLVLGQSLMMATWVSAGGDAMITVDMPATRPSQRTLGMKPLETCSAGWPPRWSAIRRAKNARPQGVAADRAPTS
jgi:hypothetical protein